MEFDWNIAPFTAWFSYYAYNGGICLFMGSGLAILITLFMVSMNGLYHAYDATMAPTVLRFRAEIQVQAPKFFRAVARMKTRDFWLKEPKNAEAV